MAESMIAARLCLSVKGNRNYLDLEWIRSIPAAPSDSTRIVE